MDTTLPVVRIERWGFKEKCTLGNVYFDGEKRMSSYELPDNGNKRSVSCIPTGRYRGVRHITPQYPVERNAYLIKDVPGRDGILIHSGNTYKDTNGCILLGLGLGFLVVDNNTVDAVTDSKKAMAELQKFLNDREFELIVVDVRKPETFNPQ